MEVIGRVESGTETESNAEAVAEDVLAEYMLLHILHLHHPWWSYAGFASLQGCNLLGQCRSNCRGVKTGQEIWILLQFVCTYI